MPALFAIPQGNIKALRSYPWLRTTCPKCLPHPFSRAAAGDHLDGALSSIYRPSIATMLWLFLMDSFCRLANFEQPKERKAQGGRIRPGPLLDPLNCGIELPNYFRGALR